MNTQNAAIPAHLNFQQPAAFTLDKKEDIALRVVLFVGDVIPDSAKTSPLYRLGGRLFADKKTVPNQIVTRCALTPLQDGMMSVNSTLVSEDARKNGQYIRTFVRHNVWNPATGSYEDIRVGAKDTMSAGLLFKKILPVQEIGSIAYVGDGCVEVSGISDLREIPEAQYHYFENWNQICMNADFPERHRALREHLQNQKAKARSAMLQNVGDAFLESCRQFETWGKNYVKTQTTVINDAAKLAGISQVYDEIAERLFGYLEITRKDSLIENFAVNQNAQSQDNNDLKSTMAMIAQLLLAQQQGVQIGNALPPIAITEQNTDELPDLSKIDPALFPSVTQSIGEEIVSDELEEDTITDPKTPNPKRKKGETPTV